MTAKPRFKLKRDALRVPIDLKTLGPAMRALPSDRWRAAAVARFMVQPGRGGGNTAACRIAGFGSTTPGSMKVVAYNVHHSIFSTPIATGLLSGPALVSGAARASASLGHE